MKARKQYGIKYPALYVPYRQQRKSVSISELGDSKPRLPTATPMRRVSTACKHLAHKVSKADEFPKMAKSGLKVKASSSEHSRELGTGANVDGLCPRTQRLGGMCD